MKPYIPRRTRGGDPDKYGRGVALRLYPDEQPCEVCGLVGRGRGVIDRHHRSSDRLDNSPQNIAFLCRKHHKAAHRVSDGRVGGGIRPRIAALTHDRGVERATVAWRLRAVGAADDAIAAHLRVSVLSIPRYFSDKRYR